VALSGWQSARHAICALAALIARSIALFAAAAAAEIGGAWLV
jgi:hypothetical protein